MESQAEQGFETRLPRIMRRFLRVTRWLVAVLIT
jgi:hypothetical protein